MEEKLSEKILDLTPPYDPKGQDLMRRYQEWAEKVMPALERERVTQDSALAEQLKSIREIKHLVIRPMGVGGPQGMQYAQRLMKASRSQT